MSPKIPPRPAARSHHTSRERTRDHRSEPKTSQPKRTPSRRYESGWDDSRSRVRDHRRDASSRPESGRPVVREHRHRYESGWEPSRPIVREHRHPRLADLFARPERHYIPERHPGNYDPGYHPPTTSYPGQYPVGDPGYNPPMTNYPGQYPVGDPGYNPVGDPGYSQPTGGNLEQFPTITPGDGRPVTMQPGIAQGEYNPAQPGYEALRQLAQQPGQVSEQQLVDLAQRGVSTDDLAKFVKAHPDKVSPETLTKFAIYEQYTSGSLRGADLGDMLSEMNKVHDAGAYHVMKGLEQTTGPINGKQMGDAILRAISDKDGHGNSTELDQVKQFARDNASRLTPAGRMAIRAYAELAEASKAQGAPGLTGAEMRQLRKRLGAAAMADDLE